MKIKNQAGQVLLLTLMTVSVGGISTGVMLGVVNSTTRSSGFFLDSTKAYYSSVAGIELVMADLLDGADASDPGYAVPSFELDGFTVSVSISAPTGDATPKTISGTWTLALRRDWHRWPRAINGW